MYSHPGYRPAPRPSPTPAILTVAVVLLVAAGAWFALRQMRQGTTTVANGRFTISTKGFRGTTSTARRWTGSYIPNARLSIDIAAANAEDLMRVNGVGEKARVATSSGTTEVSVSPTFVGPAVGRGKGAPVRSASIGFSLAGGAIESARSFEGELLLDAGPLLRFTFTRSELTTGTVKRQDGMTVSVQKVQTTGGMLEVQFGFDVPVPAQFGFSAGQVQPISSLLPPTDAELTDGMGKVHQPVGFGAGGGFAGFAGQTNRMSAHAKFKFDTAGIPGIRSVTLKLVEHTGKVERIPFKVDAQLVRDLRS